MCFFYLTSLAVMRILPYKNGGVMVSGRKLQFWMPQELMDRLKEEKERTGAPVSESLRRAADEYLKKQESKKTDE